MKTETLIKFLMDWQGCSREQALRYLDFRDRGLPHAVALWTAVRRRTDDGWVGTWTCNG